MSSEHDVTVVQIGPVMPLPNSDALDYTTVFGAPVIVRRGEFREGDVAVYVPIDSVVPDQERWAFLGGHRRIKAKRLRGTFSMGLLTATDPAWTIGQIVNTEMGITVYEPSMDFSGIDNEPDPGLMPCYTDIESLRKWSSVFDDPYEEVVATEKIHGANGRFLWAQGRLWCGSRTGIKREDPKSQWWVCGATIADKLATIPNIAVYGEVYGQVQDLKYGVPSGVRFVAFDAMDTKTRRYLDYDAFDRLMLDLAIPTVPVIYRGAIGGLTPDLAEGKSVLASGACIREGVVVRPVRERWHDRLGRVILKLVGEGYHLRKGG